jgi:hypothetical protein
MWCVFCVKTSPLPSLPSRHYTHPHTPKVTLRSDRTHRFLNIRKNKHVNNSLILLASMISFASEWRVSTCQEPAMEAGLLGASRPRTARPRITATAKIRVKLQRMRRFWVCWQTLPWDYFLLARNRPRMVPSAALVNAAAGPNGFNPSFRMPFPDRESLFQRLSNSDRFQDIPDYSWYT